MRDPKRYLIGYRHAPTMPKETEERLERLLTESPGCKAVRRLNTGQRVVEMGEEEASALRHRGTELLIEEDVVLEICSPMLRCVPVTPSGAGRDLRFCVIGRESEVAIEGATIRCRRGETEYVGRSDSTGRAAVSVESDYLDDVIVTSPFGYWSRRLGPTRYTGSETTVRLRQIVTGGQYGWGHLDVRADKVAPRFNGKGVRVALIGGGAADHPDLAIAGVENVARGEPRRARVNAAEFGTHCCGVVSAQGRNGGITGIATRAEVWSLNVLPDGTLSDLVEAIDWCVENYVDVIGVCVGTPRASLHLSAVLDDATEHGITTIAAAGDGRSTVLSPAACPGVLGVAAVGRIGMFPDDSAHALEISAARSYDGQHFLASSSNVGPEVELCAPGVAIVSTTPGGCVALDGTAVSCAIVTGAAALVLQAHREIRTCDNRQPVRVREILCGSALPLGLAGRQGATMINVGLALRSAFSSSRVPWASLPPVR